MPLCPSCRRQLTHAARICDGCGTSLDRGAVPLELVLGDGTRVPVVDDMTIGRAPGNTIRLSDPSVSRFHARVLMDADGAHLEDAGSSHGTFVDGRRLVDRVRLVDGARIQLGDAEVRFERHRGDAEAGRTMVVLPGASLVLPVAGASTLDESGSTLRPRIRSGWALKRLEAAEGDERFVFTDLRRGDFLRLQPEEAELVPLLDGRRSLSELIADAERHLGPSGPNRLARLLAELGERGLLDGVERHEEPGVVAGRLTRLFRPREYLVAAAGETLERLYRGGGFLLFTRAAIGLLAAVALAGVVAFLLLVAGGETTPFVVAGSIGLGGLVFLLGRFVVVAAHEAAHGLTVASFGRRVSKAGLKIVLVFPYAFVDTSQAWLEPRRRRLAISAAGPASDLVLGGAFALIALPLEAGSPRDVLFQLSFAAYVGALFNLNPFLDRDGYHLLVDLLREPGLRGRSRERLARVLAGKQRGADEPRIDAVYAVATLLWSLMAVAFVILLSTRYYERLIDLAPREVVWAVLAPIYLMLFAPIVVLVGRPLVERWRTPKAGADRAA